MENLVKSKYYNNSNNNNIDPLMNFEYILVISCSCYPQSQNSPLALRLPLKIVMRETLFSQHRLPI